MITLVASNLNWVNMKNVQEDQCAHGFVDFQINDTKFVTKEDGDFTLSATGLFLLRTLESDHSESSHISSYADLFADDGFSVWPDDSVVGGIGIYGANTGKDVYVIHKGENVVIQEPQGSEEVVTSAEWRNAVKSFTQQIQDFYDSNAPKIPPEDKHDREGWGLFWKEWNLRRNALKLRAE